MTQEEALDIIRFVFLHTDNHLNDDRQISAEDIHEALIMACAALCKNSLPSNLYEAAKDRVTENGRFELTAFEKMRIDDIMFGAEWGAKHTKQKPELVQHPAISYMYNADAGRGEQMKQAILALLKSDLIQVAGRGFTKTELIEWVETRPAEIKEDKNESTR